MALGCFARTAATFWGFLTLRTTAFFTRLIVAFDLAELAEPLFAVFFWVALATRLAGNFFDRAADFVDFDLTGLVALRTGRREAVALFAFGRLDLAFIGSFLADLRAVPRAAVRLVDRVRLFVTGLLTRRYEIGKAVEPFKRRKIRARA